jgi:hypothetical protein
VEPAAPLGGDASRVALAFNQGGFCPAPGGGNGGKDPGGSPAGYNHVKIPGRYLLLGPYNKFHNYLPVLLP